MIEKSFKINPIPQVWFTADTHIGHKNILKHCPMRASASGFGINDVEAHDKWIIDTWNKTVSKKDTVYILGDFSFNSSDILKRNILPKMNGKKFLIIGNHDKTSEHLDGYFQQICKIKEVIFKQKNYPFLEEDILIIMCHYPFLTWDKKTYGCIDLHGHVHGRFDDYNLESGQLRADVGWDSKLAKYNLVNLETIYKHMKKIAKDHGYNSLAEYADNERIIR